MPEKKKKLTRDVERDMNRVLRKHGVTTSSVDFCETHLAALRMVLEQYKKERTEFQISKTFKSEYTQRESKVKWNKYKKVKYRTNPQWSLSIIPLGDLALPDDEPNWDMFKDVPEEKFEYAIPKREYYERKKRVWERKLRELDEKEGKNNEG